MRDDHADLRARVDRILPLQERGILLEIDLAVAVFVLHAFADQQRFGFVACGELVDEFAVERKLGEVAVGGLDRRGVVLDLPGDVLRIEFARGAGRYLSGMPSGRLASGVRERAKLFRVP